MDRLHRLLRLARLRGDLVTVARVETQIRDITLAYLLDGWSETELRAAWGDR